MMMYFKKRESVDIQGPKRKVIRKTALQERISERSEAIKVPKISRQRCVEMESEAEKPEIIVVSEGLLREFRFRRKI